MMKNRHRGGFRDSVVLAVAGVLLMAILATAGPRAGGATPTTTPAPAGDADAGWTPLFSGKNDPADYALAYGNEAGPQPGLKASDLFAIDGDAVRVLYDWKADAAPFGLLYTRRSYSNYDLELQYRWGDRKFAPRKDLKRDAGILFHLEGTDVFWPDSVECQVQENDTGDLIAIRADCVPVDAAGVDRPFDRLQDEFNHRPRWADHETPDWNAVRVEVRGDRATYFVNGHKVNAIRKITRSDGSPLASGRIGIQAEGAEITYRNVRVRELP